jgi:hypothetical protein
MPDDPAQQEAERPDLRIISRTGEELSEDTLSIKGFQSWNCNDYVLAEVDDDASSSEGRCYVALSPKDVVVVEPRDKNDHVKWLVERKRYEEALEVVEKHGQAQVLAGTGGDTVTSAEIGQQYIQHLVGEGKPLCTHNVQTK